MKSKGLVAPPPNVAGAKMVSLSEPQWEQVVGSLHLSPQQARIVSLILGGKRDKQMAAEMGIGVPTIRTHLTRIFQRTGTADRVELILRAVACAREAERDVTGVIKIDDSEKDDSR